MKVEAGSPNRYARVSEDSKNWLYGSIKQILQVNGQDVEFTFDTGADVPILYENTSKLFNFRETWG